jgi:hypothetical protein
MYGETSYAGTPLFGAPNPAPTHFQHVAAWEEAQRLKRIKARMAEQRRRVARDRFRA